MCLTKTLVIPIIILLAINAYKGNAQNPLNYRFQYLQIEDGLPQNTITCIAKDKYGFMWFGTNNGVCRYDSYTFDLFKTNEKTQNSLPDNLVKAIATGPGNLVWIGSQKGLSYFNHNSKQITRFTDTADNGQQITKVSSIVVDNNTIWVATLGNGIFKIMLKNKNWVIDKHFCTQKNSLQSNIVNVIFLSTEKKLYAGSQNGVLILDTVLHNFIPDTVSMVLPPLTNVNDIFEDNKNNYYFATNNGMFVYSGAHKNITWQAVLVNTPNTLKHGTVNTVRQDISGQILVGSLGGLQTYNPDNGLFYDFLDNGPANFTLNNIFINTIFCDSSGNVWIGTEKGGINKFNVFQNPFYYFTHNPKNPNSLNENTINSILCEYNFLWIGTAGGGINLYNIKTQKFVHYTYNAFNPATLSNNYVTSIVRASNNKLYVGTWGGGINVLSTQGANVTVDRVTLSDPLYTNDLVNGFVSSMVNNPLGYMLIGTEGGLSMLDYKTNKFTTIIAPVNFAQQLNEIGCLLLDKKGFYWLGTRNGLFRFPQTALRQTKDDDIIISQLEYFKHETNKPATLPGDYVISLMEDSKGDVWVGTYGNGMAKATFNFKGELVFENYSTDNGLSNNVVYAMLEDNHNKIWISTDFGLCMLNTINNNIRCFYMQDGLLNNQFYWSAANKSSKGVLYFGGVNGLNYFNPDNLYEYNYFPTPKITRFTIFNNEVLPGKKFHNKTVINKPVYNTDTIYLSYKDNNISFDFSSFDYYLPQKSQYAYMLTGIDKNWVVVPSQRRFANYNNLTGGTYNFSLKASNCDGVWNQTPTTVTIIVYPPFWQTLWFKILTFIVAAALIYLFILFQMRRIIQQKKLLEEKVLVRTKKIEDQKIILEKQAAELFENNKQLAQRQSQIELQKHELESKNEEILKQRDELILLNNKVNDINQMQLRFFTNISHEFQTPLTLILSPTERLLNDYKNDTALTHLLTIINKNAHRLLMLIRQLLEIRKIETGNQNLQVELAYIKPFLTDIFSSFEELANKNSITYTHNFDIPQSAWIDKEKLENVLYNLLSNAFKFTPPGKTIEFNATTKKTGNIDILVITVADTGEGIPASKIDKLFDRFLQVTDSKKHRSAGAGIGLSLVKSLVGIMHGTITVTSEHEFGSLFKVEIPFSRAAFADHEIDTTGQVYESVIKDKVSFLYDQINSPRPVYYESQENTIERILVVEDNIEMRSFICSCLATYYKVIEAENGLTGYELAKKESPALIVSDIMMPELDGLELCQKIKNNLYTSHIPVVLLTAKTDTTEQIEGLQTGADDYMTKPFNSDLLLAKIKTIIENRNKVRAKFGKLEDVNPDELTISSLDSKFFARANEVVQKYYTEPSFDVDLFASEMLVSRSQLYTKLKAITNLSATEYINTYRLKKGMELLKNGSMQVAEVAYAIGFNDPKYFSRIFKKYYHQSPSDMVPKK